MASDRCTGPDPRGTDLRRELCGTLHEFRCGPNAEKKELEIKYRLRKCLFLYHYWMHPVFGFMSARIQTWFPFQIQIYLNGREWLAQQMKGEGWNMSGTRTVFPGWRTTRAARACWMTN